MFIEISRKVREYYHKVKKEPHIRWLKFLKEWG